VRVLGRDGLRGLAGCCSCAPKPFFLEIDSSWTEKVDM
jgi:hypothetical protein